MSPPTPAASVVSSEPTSALLSELLGRAVAVAAASTPLDATGTSYVATYHSEDGTLRAAVLCDMTLAVILAACLTLAASKQDADAARVRSLSAPLFERLREVFSAATQLLVEDACLHVSLQTVFLLPGELPEEARKAVFQPSAQSEFEVTVPSYGKGRLSLRLA
jgi:hypothetical protein